jgi:hypothetical protein
LYLLQSGAIGIEFLQLAGYIGNKHLVDGMDKILEVYFLPPLAIARVGGSQIPLPAFSWQIDQTIHGAHRTVLRPEVTLDVLSDGSLRPYLPYAIQFRDGDLLRPVAPFFELWATMQRDDGGQYDCPLTAGLLEHQGGSLEGVRYSVSVANRKAQRRTGSAACAFAAHIEVCATDNRRTPLLAFSPHSSGEEPLVLSEHPIPLGHFQAIKPIPSVSIGVDLSILRVRFTPPAGHVYGPPEAIAGPASPLPPGGALNATTLGGHLHTIVPPENRILNSNTRWSSYMMDQPGQQDPQPADSYDGARVGVNRSWGVVDDTCDGVIEAQVVVRGQRFTATARVFSSCPDFAPDRRPFQSFADDLADRDFGPVEDKDLENDICHLFTRVFETASMVNLDATRNHGILENSLFDVPNPPGLPKIDKDTMTAEDAPYADLTATKEFLSDYSHAHGLPYTDVARDAHTPLADRNTLLELLQSRREHVEGIVRPPFARVRQLSDTPASEPNRRFRDPRVPRDTVQDMRMPPYMRDSDENPLSITHRQYDALIRLLETLSNTSGGSPARPDTALARQINHLAQRLAAATDKK